MAVIMGIRLGCYGAGQRSSHLIQRDGNREPVLVEKRKDDHRATCNACKMSISSKGGNTTNMQKHLSTQHAITLQKCHVFDALGNDDEVYCVSAICFFVFLEEFTFDINR